MSVVKFFNISRHFMHIFILQHSSTKQSNSLKLVRGQSIACSFPSCCYHITSYMTNSLILTFDWILTLIRKTTVFIPLANISLICIFPGIVFFIIYIDWKLSSRSMSCFSTLRIWISSIWCRCTKKKKRRRDSVFQYIGILSEVLISIEESQWINIYKTTVVLWY